MWFSTTGFWILKLAIGWTAWDTTHSPFWTGLVATMALAPTIVLSPLFGVYADRLRLETAVPILIGIQVVSGLLLGLLAATDRMSIGALLALTLVYGSAAAAYQPMRLSMIPRMVERDHIPSASGLTAVAFNTARVIGPAIGGALIARFGLAFAFVVGAVGYVPFLVAIAGLKLRERSGTAQAKSGVWAAMLAGARHAWSMPAALPIFAVTAVNGLLGRSLMEFLPAVAGGPLQADAQGLAALTAAGGIGALLAGVSLARLQSAGQGLYRVMLVGLGISAVCVAGIAWSPGLVVACLLAGGAGLATTLAGIGSQTLLQLATDDAYRGRVMSFWVLISFGVPAAGAVVLGAIGNLLGVAPALTLFGIAGALMTLVIALRRRGASPPGEASPQG